MSENVQHPPTERLQELVEDALDEHQRAAVASHVAACEPCRTEVEELHTLFGALSELRTFAPSARFADAVMAQVRVRRAAFAPSLAPALAAAGAWLERIMPKTTRGWAAAAAMLALPIVGATLLVAWLMAQPGVTPQGLWTLTSEITASAASTGWQWAWTRFAGTSLAAWLAHAADLAQSVGRGEIGLAAVMFATMTMGSTYVLYQNLFRPEARRTEHATYVF